MKTAPRLDFSMKTQKQDNSIYAPQRAKLKTKLTLKDKIPWTEKQKMFFDIALAKNTRIMFIKGPAGTSKTLCSVYASIRLLNEAKISDIIYIRSAVESAEKSLGYLPGDADMKLRFYSLPFRDKLDEILQQEDIKTLEKEERISMFPVNFSRGMNWNAKAIIMDEAQNSSRKEIITVATRLGNFNRLFILADPKQSDLPSNKAGAFEEIFELFKNSKEAAENYGIYTFEFTKDDIVRSELVKFLIEMFDKLKPQNNGNSQNSH